MTADDRRCTATAKSTGERCGRPAIKGATVCRWHGAGSPKVKAAAQRRQAEASMQARAERILRRRLGMHLDAESPDPAQILLNLVAQKAVEVEWLDQKIQELDSDEELFWGTTKRETTESAGEDQFATVEKETREAEQNIVYHLLHKAQDQLAKYTSDALRAGIEERQTKMAEQTAQQFTWIVNQLKARLDLTPEQQQAWDPLVIEIMQAAPSGAA